MINAKDPMTTDSDPQLLSPEDTVWIQINFALSAN